MNEYIVGTINLAPFNCQDVGCATKIGVEHMNDSVFVSDDNYGAVPVPYGAIPALIELLNKAHQEGAFEG